MKAGYVLNFYALVYLYGWDDNNTLTLLLNGEKVCCNELQIKTRGQILVDIDAYYWKEFVTTVSLIQ